MNFDVSVNGRPWKIAVEPAGEKDRFAVTVRGRRKEMDGMWIDADTLSLIDGQTGAAHEFRFSRFGGRVDVAFAGRTFHTVADQARAEKEKKPLPPAAKDGRVIAPMPGRVVRLLVAVGDAVTVRQAVVVVEAMKMENELRAPRDGTVTQIAVQEGTAIETGAVLVVIE